MESLRDDFDAEVLVSVAACGERQGLPLINIRGSVKDITWSSVVASGRQKHVRMHQKQSEACQKHSQVRQKAAQVASDFARISI